MPKTQGTGIGSLLSGLFGKSNPGGEEPKIFCIGMNKTGTTSLMKTFEDLGYRVGDQRAAERLIRHYARRDFGPVIEYCKTAQVFQDVPFSWPETFVEMDKAFPGSRFILSVRDSAEQWYESLVAFHSRVFGNGKLPSGADLRNSGYVWKGWAWESTLLKGLRDPENDPYNRNERIGNYLRHNQAVRDHFRGRPNDMLEINLAEPDAYARFCGFLGIPDGGVDRFPWENRRSDAVK